MVDHKEMNDSLNRALDETHNEFCNSCKNLFVESTGDYINIATALKNYKLWYCEDCFNVKD